MKVGIEERKMWSLEGGQEVGGHTLLTQRIIILV